MILMQLLSILCSIVLCWFIVDNYVLGFYLVSYNGRFYNIEIDSYVLDSKQATILSKSAWKKSKMYQSDHYANLYKLERYS